MNARDLTLTHRSSGVLGTLGPFGKRVARQEAFEPAVREVLRAAVEEFDLAGLEVEARVGGLGAMGALEGVRYGRGVAFEIPGEGESFGSLRAFVADDADFGVEAFAALEAVASTVSLVLANLHLRRALASQKANLSAVQVASEALGTVLDEDKLYKTVLVLTLELLNSTAGVIFPGGSRPAVEAGFRGGKDPVLLALGKINPGARRALRTSVEGGSVVGARIGRSGGHFYMFRLSPGYTQAEEDALRLVARQLARAQERSRLYQTIENATLEVTESLAAALESRDGTTGSHINRTQGMVEGVARGLGLDAGKVRAARFAAVLHDIGKIGVPDAVLNKPGQLNEKEWEVMRRHPITGAKILSGISGFERVADAVDKHHERFDGKGYPRGISGEDIPVEARIISVVDAFDAMTNDRPYRKALGYTRALEELEKESGKQFDPVVVGVLKKLLEKEPAGAQRKAEKNV